MSQKSISASPEKAGLSCPVCFERYRDPKSLICAHTFCEVCIHEFVMKQKTLGLLQAGIECPLCRKVTSVHSATPPEKWSKAIPGNYALQEVLDSLSQEQIRDEKHCKICPDDKACKIASKFCIQCNKEICDDCEKIHDKFVDIRNHKIIQISEKGAVTVLQGDLDECTVHRKKIEFYCLDDKTLCCSSCAISKHRKCNEVAEIADIAEESNTELKGLVTLHMQHLKTRATNVQQFLAQKKMDTELQVELIDKRMQRDESKVIELFREMRTRIMKEANGIKCKNLKTLEIFDGECDALISIIDGSARALEAVQMHGSANQVFIALHKEEKNIAREISKAEESFGNIKYTDILFENAEIVKAVLDSTGLLGVLETPEVKVETDTIPDKRKVVLEMTASLNLTEQEKEGSISLYTGLEFLGEKRLLAVDNLNDECLIMNENLEILNSYKHSDCLYDAITLPDNEVLLTSSRALVTLAVNDENIFTKEMTTEVKCRPYSLSLCDSENLVIGTYNSQTPASILTKNGTEKNLGLNFQEKDWDIDDSRCAFDRNTKKLVVTDRCEHAVYMYDTKNKSKVLIRDDQIQEPCGVTFGPFDCFFVCSAGTSSVVQLSQYGEVLASLIVQMECPTTLCISKSGTKLALTNCVQTGRKLQLYNIIK